MNRKIMAAGCATLGVSVIGASVLTSVALTHDNDKATDDKETKPKGRDTYDHVQIYNSLDKQTILDECVDYLDSDNGKVLGLNERYFRGNIERIIRDSLKKIDMFKNNYDKYTIELNYQIINVSTIAIDVVWYISSSNPHKYYDQFQMSVSFQ